MTSETYGRETVWTPLPGKLRKWEQPTKTDELSAHSRNEALSRQHEANGTDSDFASEASLEAHSRIGKRPEAPRLREYHVWGMRKDG